MNAPQSIGAFAAVTAAAEEKQRRRIRRAWEIAERRAASEDNLTAAAIYHEAAGFASRWMYSPADNQTLERVLRALTLLFKAAAHIIVVEAANG